MNRSVLQPTTQRAFRKNLFAIDIETHGDDNAFLCATIVTEGPSWSFRDKRELIEFLKQPAFRNSWMVATNLGFDFWGIFYGEPEMKDFLPCYRGSQLIFTKTWLYDNRFNNRPNEVTKRQQMVLWIDTMNYAPFSVEKWGDILKLPKLAKPASLGRVPKDEDEWRELLDYNRRDAEVSLKAFRFLQASFEKLGCTVKPTIAASSMSGFKNRFLDATYYGHDEDTLLRMFEGYYGGRVECFKRGTFANLNYYDINSLFPTVMREHAFPDPNTHRHRTIGDLTLIKEYDGFTRCTVRCPPMRYPLLPLRKDDKLIFPVGTFSGTWPHVELRKALELGYEILEYGPCDYFKGSCRPFARFVDELYAKRLELKRLGDPMELVAKLMMNSLYGKFGQRFTDREEWLPNNFTPDQLENLGSYELVGDFVRVRKPRSRPASFCFPEWAAYITAYARLRLYGLIVKHDAIYVDTDSIHTGDTLATGDGLGELKLEMRVEHAIIVRPKFYYDRGEKLVVKIKGVSLKSARVGCEKFVYGDEHVARIIREGRVRMQKFSKFKESVRRRLQVNRILDIEKKLNTEDTKRVWPARFDQDAVQDSEPLTVTL